MIFFEHSPHPWHRQRALAGPATTAGQVPPGRNSALGLKITSGVGTMWCAYAFAGLALVSLPAALASHSALIIVSWLAQTMLQLVLLPVIIVGQNIQAKAADARGEQTWKDAEAILHEVLEVHRHLLAQDAALTALTRDGPR